MLNQIQEFWNIYSDKERVIFKKQKQCTLKVEYRIGSNK